VGASPQESKSSSHKPDRPNGQWEARRKGQSKEHSMSSPQLNNYLSAGQHDWASQLADTEREPSTASNSPRRGAASRTRRSVIAVAIASAVAIGSAAVLTSPVHTADATPQLSAGTAVQALHVGGTSASFVRRIRTLEAAGYVDVACAVHGDLMFNPQRHRYATVRS
jgi:hypothetical protein